MHNINILNWTRPLTSHDKVTLRYLDQKAYEGVKFGREMQPNSRIMFATVWRKLRSIVNINKIYLLDLEIFLTDFISLATFTKSAMTDLFIGIVELYDNDNGNESRKLFCETLS